MPVLSSMTVRGPGGLISVEVHYDGETGELTTAQVTGENASQLAFSVTVGERSMIVRPARNGEIVFPAGMVIEFDEEGDITTPYRFALESP